MSRGDGRPDTPGTRSRLLRNDSDSYGTHKHPGVKARFARHPEYVPHFTPTSSSRRNRVERFFARIAERRIRRGVFRSVEEREAAIAEYLATRNADPKPFVWTEDADLILRKVQKVCERLTPPEKPETDFQLRTLQGYSEIESGAFKRSRA